MKIALCRVSPIPLPAVLLAVLLTVLLTACDGENQKPQSAASAREKTPPLVGLLLYKADDAYISLVSAELTRLIEPGARLERFDADYNQLTQNEQIDAAISAGARALIVNLVESQAVALVLDKAKKAGLPLVFFNREPDLVMLKSYSDKACFVGTNVNDAGKLQGDLIAGIWGRHEEYDRNGDGRLQFVMFQGDPDNPEAMARTEYSVKQAMEKGVDMEQLGQSYMCAWDEKLAEQAMSLALAEFGGRIELVIANNDAMALGAIAALNKEGWNLPGADGPRLPVVGVDALPQAVKAIKDGRMSATVVQDAGAMAGAVAALLMNALKGRDFLEGTPYVWDRGMPAVRIPYAPLGGED